MLCHDRLSLYDGTVIVILSFTIERTDTQSFKYFSIYRLVCPYMHKSRIKISGNVEIIVIFQAICAIILTNNQKQEKVVI